MFKKKLRFSINEKGGQTRSGFNPNGSHHRVFEGPTKWTEITENK